jgi:hypothetical protein
MFILFAETRLEMAEAKGGLIERHLVVGWSGFSLWIQIFFFGGWKVRGDERDVEQLQMLRK